MRRSRSRPLSGSDPVPCLLVSRSRSPRAVTEHSSPTLKTDVAPQGLAALPLQRTPLSGFGSLLATRHFGCCSRSHELCARSAPAIFSGSAPLEAATVESGSVWLLRRIAQPLVVGYRQSDAAPTCIFLWKRAGSGILSMSSEPPRERWRCYVRRHPTSDAKRGGGFRSTRAI